jgi:hypothetical protein
MTPANLKTAATQEDRKQLEADFYYQCKNEVEDVLGQHTPDWMPYDSLDEIREEVLENTRQIIQKLTERDLDSDKTLPGLIALAVQQTRRIMQARSIEEKLV